MSSLFRKAPLVTAVALATAASFSHAQLQLEEVIVTAQKRAESLQDVPISVSAIQGDKIADAGIGNMSALADHVPNLHIAEAPVNTNIYMRGMGSGNNQAFEQSVGMYIDGVYMGRGRQYRSPFMDVERIEVLRGPQGTLFGKNTVAGAVNILTASPGFDDEFNGNLSVDTDTNGGLSGEGVLSGAVTDNLALRAAFKVRETDGFVENTYLNQDEPEIEETVFRLSAVWQITDNLEAEFKYSMAEYDREGVGSGGWLYLDAEQRAEQVPNRSAFANIAYLVTDTWYPEYAERAGNEFEIYKDNGFGRDSGTVDIGIEPESSDNDIDNFVATFNYYMGEHTITSITGYSQYQYVDGADVDWLPLQFIDRYDDQEFEQISQEIRITSPIGEKFEYIAGAYYEENDLEFDRRVTIDLNIDGLVPATIGSNSLLLLLTGFEYGPEQISRSHYYQLDSDSWALFAQGTYNISDTLHVTVGVRYTKETKDVVSTQFLADSDSGHDVPNDNEHLGEQMAANFNSYTFDYDEDRNTDAFLPSLNVTWDASDDDMLYFTFSQGFKSGGFTSADDGQPGDLEQGEWGPYDPTNPSDEFEFDDEEVDAFEIGGKHTLLDGAMTANWAAFYTEYSDLQISIFKGVGFTVTNADAEVKGLEFDLLWQATEELRLGFNAAYLDAEWDNYAHAPCTAIQLDMDALCGVDGGVSDNDLSGQTTTFAPEYSGTLFFDYSHLFGNGMELFAGGEVNYSDDFNSAGDKDPIDVTESFTKINLRLGLRAANESWDIMLYGRNITDEEVYSISFDTPVLAGSHSAQIDEGELYGARFSYHF